MLLGAGFLSGWVKSFWNFIYDHTILVVEKRIKVSITVEDCEHQHAFTWLNLWMEKHLVKKKISTLRIESKYDYEKQQYSKDPRLVPGYGFYFIFWKFKLVTFSSSKENSTGSQYDQKSKITRTLKLTVWGTRDRNKLLEILTEARDEFDVRQKDKVSYYLPDGSDYWDDHPLTERELDSIYLPENQMKKIIGSFENFFSSKDKYRKLGIPWRTGFLLYGPPGTGKSSLVQALSYKFRVPIYYVNLNSIMGAKQLMSLLACIHTEAIVLMEDIDGINASQKDDDKKENFGIKTSELLNILDGLVATENRIIIMTTNHIDKLDPALIRAGRIDQKFHLDYAEDTEIKRFYTRASEYYPLEEFSSFRKKLPEKCTIADAQVVVFDSLHELTKEENYDTVGSI